MPRKATGSVWFDPAKGHWFAIVTQKDRTRKWFPLEDQKDASAREEAKKTAALISIRWRERGCVDADTTETLNEYFKRWAAERESRNLSSASDDVGRYNKWIADELGTLEVAGVDASHLEELVAALDEHVRAELLSWKTAKNVWGILTKLFDDACRSKDRSLRVRKDNPARDVRGPDRGDDRPGPYLFPSELATLLACDTITAQRRWLWALAVYTGMRAGELRALDWADVHEDEGYIHVHRSVKRDAIEIKSTKGRRARKVPIEPALALLLGVMRDLGDGRGRVFPTMLARNVVPRALRSDLLAAGVTRAELHTDVATTRKLDFHDLRHTYGTWRAIRGDAIQKIQFAMGHTDLKTTQRYINEALVFDVAKFGVPFGPLPIESLVKRWDQRFIMRNRGEKWWRRRESKLTPFELRAMRRMLENAVERAVGRASPSERNVASLVRET
jgi:integrase